jgi:hypothetical protein
MDEPLENLPSQESNKRGRGLDVTAVTVETRDHGASAADCGPVGVPVEISLGSSSGESVAFLFRGPRRRFQMK